MLLFVLRCSFWLALVAMALPWFVADKSPSTAGGVASRPVAGRPHVMARAQEAPRYFDDVTGSLDPTAGCTKRSKGCGDDDAKVDLIALTLGGKDPAPRKAATNHRPTPAARSAAPHAPHRAASIEDVLAR